MSSACEHEEHPSKPAAGTPLKVLFSPKISLELGILLPPHFPEEYIRSAILQTLYHVIPSPLLVPRQRYTAASHRSVSRPFVFQCLLHNPLSRLRNQRKECEKKGRFPNRSLVKPCNLIIDLCSLLYHSLIVNHRAAKAAGDEAEMPVD